METLGGSARRKVLVTAVIRCRTCTITRDQLPKNCKMQLQLADFATVQAAGNYSGINWGAVDSRVQDRQRNQKMGADVSTTMQLGQFFGKQSTWCSVLCIILLSPFCCCSCKTAAQDKDLNEEPNSKVSCCVEVFVISLSLPLIIFMPFHFPTGTMHACLPKNRFNATSCDDDCCGGTAAVWQLEGRFLLLHCLDVCTNTFTNSFSHLFPLQVQ